MPITTRRYWPLWRRLRISRISSTTTQAKTAISFSKGSGSSSSSSTANRIGTYVSFEQDFSLGGVVDLGGVEFETSMEAEWNNSIEKEKTFTMTNSFSAEQAESAVVLICIPVTVYHYKTTSADGSRNTRPFRFQSITRRQ